MHRMHPQRTLEYFRVWSLVHEPKMVTLKTRLSNLLRLSKRPSLPPHREVTSLVAIMVTPSWRMSQSVARFQVSRSVVDA